MRDKMPASQRVITPYLALALGGGGCWRGEEEPPQALTRRWRNVLNPPLFKHGKGKRRSQRAAADGVQAQGGGRDASSCWWWCLVMGEQAGEEAAEDEGVCEEACGEVMGEEEGGWE